MHGVLEVEVAPRKLTFCININIIIINGRENKCTTAIIITCKPILTSRSRLLTYKRLSFMSVLHDLKFERLVSVAGFNVSCSSLDIRQGNTQTG